MFVHTHIESKDIIRWVIGSNPAKGNPIDNKFDYFGTIYLVVDVDKISGEVKKQFTSTYQFSNDYMLWNVNIMKDVIGKIMSEEIEGKIVKLDEIPKYIIELHTKKFNIHEDYLNYKVYNVEDILIELAKIPGNSKGYSLRDQKELILFEKNKNVIFLTKGYTDNTGKINVLEFDRRWSTVSIMWKLLIVVGFIIWILPWILWFKDKREYDHRVYRIILTSSGESPAIVDMDEIFSSSYFIQNVKKTETEMTFDISLRRDPSKRNTSDDIINIMEYVKDIFGKMASWKRKKWFIDNKINYSLKKIIKI